MAINVNVGPCGNTRRPISWVLLLGTLTWSCSVATSSFGGPKGRPTLQDHLSAGEFGPARQLALQAPTDNQRDRQLHEVAVAQLTSGAYRGSLQTAYDIHGDSVRAETFGRIRVHSAENHRLRGGGVQADFDSLIELITSTVAPDSWDEVGGEGAIAPFESGVRVDAQGVMHQIQSSGTDHWLEDVRRRSAFFRGHQDVRKASELRKVSLPRLERQIQMLWAQGRRPSEAMSTLAGLQHVEYLLVYPDTGDLVLAGPAGDWHYDQQGRAVSVAAGDPVLALDDLVVVLRNALDGNGRFGCSITPRRENLARTQAFLKSTGRRPVRPGRRNAWLDELRDQLGAQTIEVHGIDPSTRTARVIIEADYHMKLIGMGLAEGVLGVTSYLDSIYVAPGQAPPRLGVLRWWFALNYRGVQASQSRDAYKLQGPGVKVLSENELLTLQGDRVHTGKSDDLNRLFTDSFTRHFGELAEKFPVYAELRNVFDLAVIAALIRHEDLTNQVNWHADHFRNPQAFQVTVWPEPKEVESVVNHRVINRKYIVAGVSGGVSVDTRGLLKKVSIRTDGYDLLQTYQDEGKVPTNLARGRWWWD